MAENVSLQGLHGCIPESKRLTAGIEHLGSACGAQQHMLIHDLLIENVCLRLSASLCSIVSWISGGAVLPRRAGTQSLELSLQMRGGVRQAGFLAVHADAAVSRWAAFWAS